LLPLALRLPAFFVDVFNSDGTFLGAQAEVISHGGKLYQEAADRKPPLVPYIYAATFAIFATTALWSVRVMAMLAVALTALFLALEARRRYGNRAAWIAGVLMVLASVAFAPQDGQAANFEIFIVPSMTAAFAVVNAPIVWALPRAWRERRTAGSGDTDLWLWLLSAVVSVAVGLRFFGHYYLQLLPPLVLITTGVLARSSGRAVKRTIAL